MSATKDDQAEPEKQKSQSKQTPSNVDENLEQLKKSVPKQKKEEFKESELKK